jgi:hypothetical protein
MGEESLRIVSKQTITVGLPLFTIDVIMIFKMRSDVFHSCKQPLSGWTTMDIGLPVTATLWTCSN